MADEHRPWADEHRPWADDRRPRAYDHRLRVVAHRAGNDPDALRAAVAGGADIVEADVYAFRGRIEVRHARTLGPWWSRRFEVDGRRPRLIAAAEPRRVLAEIVRSAAGVQLMLDIKGVGRGGGPAPAPLPAGAGLRLAPVRAVAPTGARWAAAVGARIAAAWDEIGAGAPLIVSAEAWPALSAFLVPPPVAGGRPRAREGVTVVLSAGTARQASVVAERAAAVEGAGIGLPAALLSQARVRALRAVTGTVFCWGMTTRAQVRQAHEWGVTHAIVDDLGVARGNG